MFRPTNGSNLTQRSALVASIRATPMLTILTCAWAADLEAWGSTLRSSDRNRGTNAFLIKVGELLYGKHRWQHQLYSDLGISRRTLAYYKSGTHPVPMNVVYKAIDLLRTRQVDIMSALPSTFNENLVNDHISEMSRRNKNSLDNGEYFLPYILRMDRYISPAAPRASAKLEKISPEKITNLIEEVGKQSDNLTFEERVYSLTKIRELQRYVITDDLSAEILFFSYMIERRSVIYLALFRENSNVPVLTFDLRYLDWRRGSWRYLRDFAWLH